MANWHSFSRPQSGQFAREKLIRGIEPKTPHVVTSDLLHHAPDAASPGRLCSGRRGRHARSTDSRVCGAGSDHLRRPHVASGLPPMIPRGSRALRCGRRRSSQRSSGPFPPFTKRAQQKLSRFVRTSARQKCVGPLLSLRGFRGGFALAELDGAASLALAPAQSARRLERREKGIPLLLGGGRLCCADAGSASGTFRAAWP